MGWEESYHRRLLIYKLWDSIALGIWAGSPAKKASTFFSRNSPAAGRGIHLLVAISPEETTKKGYPGVSPDFVVES